jgi:hypothetical protein
MPPSFALDDPYKSYSTLSFRDLVEARDFYHSQLMRKQNVVGTALGRYLQRKSGVNREVKKTLSNTEVKKNSWPCLLVSSRNGRQKTNLARPGTRSISAISSPIPLRCPTDE